MIEGKQSTYTSKMEMKSKQHNGIYPFADPLVFRSNILIALEVFDISYFLLVLDDRNKNISHFEYSFLRLT